MKTLTKFFPVMITFIGLTIGAFSQVTRTAEASITAKIVESVNVSNTGLADAGSVAIMLIILPETNGTTTAATYYYKGTVGYSYSDSPLIFKRGTIASFIIDPVLAAGPNLIAGVYVSISPSNSTVNYN